MLKSLATIVNLSEVNKLTYNINYYFLTCLDKKTIYHVYSLLQQKHTHILYSNSIKLLYFNKHFPKISRNYPLYRRFQNNLLFIIYFLHKDRFPLFHNYIIE